MIKNPKILVIFFKNFLAILMIAWLVSCGDGGEKWIDDFYTKGIDRKYISVSEVFSRDSDFVCVLVPYQDRIHSDYPYSKLVNQKISSLDLSFGEGYWYMVFINEDEVDYFRFLRSGSYDYAVSDRSHKVENYSLIAKQANVEFTGKSCEAYEIAILYFFEDESRAYVTLGRFENE